MKPRIFNVPRMFEAFHNPNYLFLWPSNFLSYSSRWTQVTILGWLILERTGSPFLVALVAFFAWSPMFFLGMLGGYLADSVNRQKVLLFSQSVTLISTFIMTALLLTDLLEIWHSYLIIAVNGSVLALEVPSRRSLIHTFLGNHGVPNGVALDFVALSASRMLGPILAGLLTQFWGFVGVDEYSTITGLSEAETIISPLAGQTAQTPGFAYTPLHSILAPLNYGKVNMQGIDIGLSYLMPEYNLIFSGNFSFYSSTEYYNKLTKKNDPINAPKFKMKASISWSNEKFGNISIKYRHVDRFLWKDGIWSGYIGPYDLIDLLYSYQINEYLEINLTAQNIFNDVHKELIGGAFMGRQFIIRLGASI